MNTIMIAIDNHQMKSDLFSSMHFFLYAESSKK